MGELQIFASGLNKDAFVSNEAASFFLKNLLNTYQQMQGEFGCNQCEARSSSKLTISAMPAVFEVGSLLRGMIKPKCSFIGSGGKEECNGKKVSFRY